MAVLVDMSQDECLSLLRSDVVGRVAVCTPDGPRIVPVNYSVLGDSVVIRTAPYSVLGTYGRATPLAMEVDRLDTETHQGWSVVVRGDGRMVDDMAEMHEIREHAEPSPWAGGAKPMYIRLRWREVTGRRVLPNRSSALAGHAARAPGR